MKKICVPINHRKKEQGLTRVDLLAGLCALFLLGAAAWPVLAATGEDGKIQTCKNNLKKIGLAFTAWSDGHGQRMPWRVDKKDGGATGLSTAGMAWVHYYFLTNDLKNPKVLACPADKVTPASNWQRNPQGGYLNPSYRANAVSYFVGLDGAPESPKAILSGDRNLTFSARNQFCDYANVKTASSLKAGDETVQWENSIHEQKGNILLYDGTVLTVDSPSMRKALSLAKAVHVDNHVLVPR